MIFVSSTIGLVAGKGRSSHNGSLSFAWWIATTALAISIVCGISLIILSFYILPNPRKIEFDSK